MSALGKLFADIPQELPQELTQTLLAAPMVRIERIVSRGHVSPKDFWYDQNENEWVLLIAGAARLQFADRMAELKAGDFIDIPAHEKHRVEWTDPEVDTIWLAVFYG
jgi:cupin 2 domain-containing protein